MRCCLNNRPDMDCCESSNWLFDFGNWIETAYGGKLASYEEMAEEFNANRKRKFIEQSAIVEWSAIILDLGNTEQLDKKAGM